MTALKAFKALQQAISLYTKCITQAGHVAFAHASEL